MPDSLLTETCRGYHFFQSSAGKYLSEWELIWHDQFLANIFGYNAVQIGLSQIPFLRQNRIRHQYRLDVSVPADIIAYPTALPIASNTVDLVVLPHQLAFSTQPHQILREAERILVPEGKLVITEFNPNSLWGMYCAWRNKIQQTPDFPWNAEYISLSRLKDWLKLLNMEPTLGKFGRYLPPFAHTQKPDRLNWTEAMGDRWWPTLGAVYILCAVKKTCGIRLITQSWGHRPVTMTKSLSAISA